MYIIRIGLQTDSILSESTQSCNSQSVGPVSRQDIAFEPLILQQGVSTPALPFELMCLCFTDDSEKWTFCLKAICCQCLVSMKRRQVRWLSQCCFFAELWFHSCVRKKILLFLTKIDIFGNLISR